MYFLKNNKGTALFLILIGVALFAALSYAVTQSSRQGGTISKEDLAMKASVMLQYTAFVQSRVQKMMLVNGTTENTLSFGDPGWGHTRYKYAVAQPDVNKLFSKAGGDVDFDTLSDFGNVTFSGVNRIIGIGCDDDDGSCAELLMTIGDMDLEICTAINRLVLGTASVASDNIALPYDAHPTRYFKGTFTSDNDAGFIMNHASHIGKINGCVEDEYPDDYVYYHVLIER